MHLGLYLADTSAHTLKNVLNEFKKLAAAAIEAYSSYLQILLCSRSGRLVQELSNLPSLTAGLLSTIIA
jgi:hypothetical protein